MQDAPGLRLRIGTFSASAETRGATIASSPGAALEPWGGGRKTCCTTGRRLVPASTGRKPVVCAACRSVT